VGVLAVPATVAGLDLDMVVEVLARNACNVTDAAADLRVPASDLRRLMWSKPSLQDQAFEVVEARLDKAEKNINEALHSDDPRMRVAASMFTLRNSVWAKRRGWITSASAGADDNIGGQSARETVFTWRPYPSELLTEEAQKKEAHRQAEVQRAIAEGHKVVQFSWGDPGEGEGDDEGDRPDEDVWCPPVCDDGPRDEVLGGAAAPPVLIEHVPDTGSAGLDVGSSEEPGAHAPAEVAPEPPALPVWPGPYPPPPLVAHLYAPYAPPPRVAPARPRR
jgi:hypothetical protein